MGKPPKSSAYPGGPCLAKKNRLSDELKGALRRKGLSLAQAAENAQLPYESIKSWLRRNQFPRRDLPTIARVAGFSQDIGKLEAEYEFTWSRGRASQRTRSLLDDEISISASNALIDSRLPRIKRILQDVAADVEGQIAALAEGDMVVQCGLDTEPVETLPLYTERVGKVIANAIKKKARLVYLLPSKAALASIKKSGVYPIPTVESIETPYLELQSFVQKRVKDPALVSEYLQFIDADHGPFFVPGHRYSIIQYEHTQRSEFGSRGFGLFPIGLGNESIKLYLPLEEDVAHRFWAFCQKALEKNKAHSFSS